MTKIIFHDGSFVELREDGLGGLWVGVIANKIGNAIRHLPERLTLEERIDLIKDFYVS